MGDAGSPEDRLIAHYFKPLAKHPGAFGFTDDAAAITPPAGHDLVLKTDGLIAGVHFFPDDPADGVARKALRVNLSDLAAKGAAPLGFLLAIALPKGFSEDWLAAFARGLGEDADALPMPAARRRHGFDAGSDLDLDLGLRHAAAGHDGRGAAAPRPATTCSSAARSAMRRSACGCVRMPVPGKPGSSTPRCATIWSRAIACRSRATRSPTRCARMHRAAMDVSDGLAADLAKLCRASNVSADIDVARVPLSAGRRAGARRPTPTLIEPILTGGEDYEILCAVSPRRTQLSCRRAGRGRACR